MQEDLTLFEQYTRWAYKLGRTFCKRKNIHGCDRPIFYNATLIGLWRASNRYDRSLGVPFKSFAMVRIHGELYDTCRLLSYIDERKKQRLIDSGRMVPQICSNQEEGILLLRPAPVQRLFWGEDVTDLVRSLGLTAVQEFVLEQLVNGSTTKRIAQGLGVTPSRVRQIVIEIRDNPYIRRKLDALQ